LVATPLFALANAPSVNPGSLARLASLIAAAGGFPGKPFSCRSAAITSESITNHTKS